MAITTQTETKETGKGLSDGAKEELNSLRMLRQGDLVKGKVIEKGVRIMTLDLGAYGIGAVYRGEMQNARDIVKSLKEGDEVSAKVVKIDNEDGYTELSLTEADKQKSWEAIADMKEREESFKVKILSFNKGGLVADLKGLQAFLPISQLETGLEEKNIFENKDDLQVVLSGLVGKEVEVKLLDVNPRTKKLIISEKATKELSTKELLKNYTEGQIIDGMVSGIADFGVFVRFTDNPAIEGLIHVSELSYRIVENPKEVVKVDAEVKAKILEIRDGKISLSLKALKEDPWLKLGKEYKEGAEVKGLVYGIHPYGAIVNLSGEIQGQVHVSDFGSAEEMKKRLVQGNEYTFTIESSKPEERKILLKLKD
jgi:ribosomal protein S1